MNIASIKGNKELSSRLLKASEEQSFDELLLAIEHCFVEGLSCVPILEWFTENQFVLKGTANQFFRTLLKLTSPFRVQTRWYEISEEERKSKIEAILERKRRVDSTKSQSILSDNQFETTPWTGTGIFKYWLAHALQEMEIKNNWELFELENAENLSRYGLFSPAYPFHELLNHLYGEDPDPAMIIGRWLLDYFDTDISDPQSCVYNSICNSQGAKRQIELLLPIFEKALTGKRLDRISTKDKDLVSFLISKRFSMLAVYDKETVCEEWIKQASSLHKVSQPVYVLFLQSLSDLPDIANPGYTADGLCPDGILTESEIHLLRHIAFSPKFCYRTPDLSLLSPKDADSSALIKRLESFEFGEDTRIAVREFAVARASRPVFLPPQFLPLVSFSSIDDRYDSVVVSHFERLGAYSNERLGGNTPLQILEGDDLQMFYELSDWVVEDDWEGYLPLKVLELIGFGGLNLQRTWSEGNKSSSYRNAIEACLDEREYILANALMSFYVISEVFTNDGKCGSLIEWKAWGEIIERLYQRSGHEMTIRAIRAASQFAEEKQNQKWATKFKNTLPIGSKSDRLIEQGKPFSAFNIAPQPTLFVSAQSFLEDCLSQEQKRKISPLGRKFILEAITKIFEIESSGARNLINRDAGSIVHEFRKFFECELGIRMLPSLKKHWNDLRDLNIQSKDASRISCGGLVRILLILERAPRRFVDELRAVIDIDARKVWSDLDSWIQKNGNKGSHGSFGYGEAMSSVEVLMGENGQRILPRFIDALK